MALALAKSGHHSLISLRWFCNDNQERIDYVHKIYVGIASDMNRHKTMSY
jgi:hypothetical protein